MTLNICIYFGFIQKIHGLFFAEKKSRSNTYKTNVCLSICIAPTTNEKKKTYKKIKNKKNKNKEREETIALVFIFINL